jgi:hypothetical protein
MKAYITKYALAEGVTIAEGSISEIDPKVFLTFGGDDESYDKPDWHETWAGAFHQAELMRLGMVSFYSALTFKEPTS